MRLPLLHWALILGIGSTAACGGDRGPDPSGTAEVTAGDSLDAGPRGRFERSLVFATGSPEDHLMVPWVLEAVTRPGGVDRTHRGWLVRDEEWEPFYSSSWATPPRREPWRILPDGPFRILVGEGDRLDRVIFEGDGRRLQLVLDESLAEWTDDRGGTFTMLDAALILGDRRIDGRILDVSEGRGSAEPDLGDWLFLRSESGWSVVLKTPMDTGESTDFQLWVLGPGGEGEGPWPRVTLTWSESRTFEPARRPIPEIITIASADGEVSGSLEVTSLQLETRDGDGPVLPVDGIIGVTGEIDLGDPGVLELRGMMRHRRR